MRDPIGTDQERRLAEILRIEAEATRPAFSEALQARICESLKPLDLPAKGRSGGWRSRPTWLSAAVAASLLVTTVSVASWLGRSPHLGLPPEPHVAAQPDPRETAAAPDLIAATTSEVAGQLGLMVDEALTAGQWAYLDHDARVAVQLLLDQLPFDAESTENL